MGWRGYYIDRHHVFDHLSSNDYLLGKLQKKNLKAEELLTAIAENHFTHVMIRKDLFFQWLQNATPDTDSKITIEFLNNYLKHLYSYQDYALYEIAFLAH